MLPHLSKRINEHPGAKIIIESHPDPADGYITASGRLQDRKGVDLVDPVTRRVDLQDVLEGLDARCFRSRQ